MTYDVLIVDDEKDISDGIAGILSDEGYITATAHDADSFLRLLEKKRPHLIFLDIWLQGSRLDGLQLLQIVTQTYPQLPVVMISGHGTIETAVTAIKLGAYDFIEKPFKADRLILVSQRALEASSLKKEISYLRAKTGDSSCLIGKSAPMHQLRQSIERIGPTNSRVMIFGPPGSGKELTARCLHKASHRATNPFVVLSAATMTPEHVEEELFGVEAKNDGHKRKIGALEEAHGGTLYLDEICDMPLETQGKILRVLVDQNFQRVGGTARVHVNVRIISSTSRDLTEAMIHGTFREDLFHRLSVIPIKILPLAERREDIPDLIHFFIEQISTMSGMPRRTIAEDAIALLQLHDWPGNIRQLRNNIERLMILAAGDLDTHITADMLPPEVGALTPELTKKTGGERLMSMPLREAREIFEKEYLIAQISRFGGNISRTAEFVGMERSALHRKLKILKID